MLYFNIESALVAYHKIAQGGGRVIFIYVNRALQMPKHKKGETH